MTQPEREGLLENADVRAEIDRHKWIESEKAGYDIGFDTAAEDWLSKHADAWIKHNVKASKKSAKTNKRSAKSYVF